MMVAVSIKGSKSPVSSFKLLENLTQSSEVRKS